VSKVVDLIGVFGLLSVLAVGGGAAVLPEMKHLTESEHHWLTENQFVHIYSLGQVAPGPNMLMVGVIGQLVAGWPGAVAALVAFLAPASALTWGVGRLWARFAGWPWLDAIQRGLGPVSIGLALSGAITVARGSFINATTVVIGGAVLVILLVRHINPVYLILASGVVGALLLSS
jgi:chromate transporter